MIWKDTNQKLGEYFQDGALPAILSVDRRHYDEKKYKFLMHGHENFCEITYVYQGAGIYRQGMDTCPAAAGDLLLYNAGDLHVTQPLNESGVSYYSIGIANLKKKGMPLNHLYRAQDGCRIPAGRYRKDVENICEEMYRLSEGRQKNRGTELTVQLLGTALIVLLDALAERRQEKEKKGVQGDTRVKDYLDRHYTEDLSLGSVAAGLGYSETHLSHFFKRTYGESPMKYVRNRRLSEAQLLLHSTDLQVSRIAAKVGYENTSYFVTLFSKVVGMTPTKYREYVKKDVHRL